jgi:Fe-Mn family superoxide dismutase
MMTRRQAIKTTALATAACAALLPSAGARQPAAPPAGPASAGPFRLPPLPYAFDALEPHIDAQTMQIHHNMHHLAYVTNLNRAVAGSPGLEKKSIEELIRDLNAVPAEIRMDVQNNGGGHYNHSIFWQMMKKDGGGEPKGDLAGAMEKRFRNFDNFKVELARAATMRFGSGWAWLVIDPNKKLEIRSTANQDSPLSSGEIPLLGIDVWEHAYYLKHQNRRPEYIAAWFNTIDWDFVAGRYHSAGA